MSWPTSSHRSLSSPRWGLAAAWHHVSAFTSLWVNPPMVLVVLDRGPELLGLIRSARRFGVNVLSRIPSGWACAFARKGGTGKFVGVRWEADVGIPRPPGASGWLVCGIADFIGGGDHV